MTQQRQQEMAQGGTEPPEIDPVSAETRAWLEARGLVASARVTKSTGDPLSEAERREITEVLQLGASQLEHQRRLAALGEMSAGVAHEVRNILTGILGLSQLQVDRDQLSSNLNLIAGEARRCTHLLGSLLGLASAQECHVSPITVQEVVEPVMLLLTSEIKSRRCRVVIALQPGLPAFLGRLREMQEALLNIVLNALQAVEQAGQIAIRATRDGGNVLLSVVDDGPGIAQDSREHVFVPFYTTKSKRGGTGLGLSRARELAQNNGCTLLLDSSHSQGTAFTFRIPLGEGLTEGE